MLYGLGLLNDDGGAGDPTLSAARKLASLLRQLFGEQKVELHHNPALVNRRRKKNGDYDPPANSKHHLEYMVEDAHDVETRIRGRNGQHSDLGLARKNKRIAKNRKPRPKSGIKWITKAQAKKVWPSRPFPKGRGFNRRKA